MTQERSVTTMSYDLVAPEEVGVDPARLELFLERAKLEIEQGTCTSDARCDGCSVGIVAGHRSARIARPYEPTTHWQRQPATS